MYLNYYAAEVNDEHDNPPIGILLCTEKGDTLVRYATAGLDPNIFVQKYKFKQRCLYKCFRIYFIFAKNTH